MADFLLELLSEEIPARMQVKAAADLGRIFTDILGNYGVVAEAVETYATPRRLALIARGLPETTEAKRQERKGPRADAPEQAIAGFLKSTGLSRDQLEEREDNKGNRVLFAVQDVPGQPLSDVLNTVLFGIMADFPWPKSMRWGEASVSTESPRWVRPLQGIVALLGEQIVDFEIAGIRSGAATVGHRFHHPGPITIGGAHDYAEKLRACHVVLDPAERRRIIAEGAARAAAEAGLALIQDEGLLAENAGLTEWPMPLLGAFDPAFLDVPSEVVQLTMRTNQKYFALTRSSPGFPGEGDQPEAGGGASSDLAPAFLCVANIEASDGGAAIVEGNRKVLAARLADAKFFWEQDLKVPLAEQAKKLGQIVFHEKLGTVADKVERVAKLARWLVEEGIVTPAKAGVSGREGAEASPDEIPASAGMTLADMAETAARLCKADLVTGLVGEFPELQGIIGGHLARAQGLDPQIADAIRDHYKPVGQADDVPTAPVTVAVSLADKLDTLFAFFALGQLPTGSKDPFALRRAALSVCNLLTVSKIRMSLAKLSQVASFALIESVSAYLARSDNFDVVDDQAHFAARAAELRLVASLADVDSYFEDLDQALRNGQAGSEWFAAVLDFFADRLKAQQREAGVRHDLIDAVFALGGEDDLVRLLARVKALQAFVETAEGRDLLAGYKRAANILRKENWPPPVTPAQAGVSGQEGAEANPPGIPASAGMTEQEANKTLSYAPEKEESALIAALDSAEPKAAAAVEAEDFEGAMAALASLRAPVDSFFDRVTVNDPNDDKRTARLDLLARMRDAVHRVADFSKIEG